MCKYLCIRVWLGTIQGRNTLQIIFLLFINGLIRQIEKQCHRNVYVQYVCLLSDRRRRYGGIFVFVKYNVRYMECVSQQVDIQ